MLVGLFAGLLKIQILRGDLPSKCWMILTLILAHNFRLLPVALLEASAQKFIIPVI